MIIWIGTFGLWAAIGLVTGAFNAPSYEECLKQRDAGQLTEECRDTLSRPRNEPMAPF